MTFSLQSLFREQTSFFLRFVTFTYILIIWVFDLTIVKFITAKADTHKIQILGVSTMKSYSREN